MVMHLLVDLKGLGMEAVRGVLSFRHIYPSLCFLHIVTGLLFSFSSCLLAIFALHVQVWTDQCLQRWNTLIGHPESCTPPCRRSFLADSTSVVAGVVPKGVWTGKHMSELCSYGPIGPQPPEVWCTVEGEKVLSYSRYHVAGTVYPKNDWWIKDTVPFSLLFSLFQCHEHRKVEGFLKGALLGIGMMKLHFQKQPVW